MLTLFAAMAMAGSIPAGAQTNIANYRLAKSSGTYVPITGGTVVASGAYDNDISGSVNLGGTFTFGGTAFTTCYISANGFITFGAAPSGTNYTPMSTLGSTTGAIAAYAQDAGGSAVTGASPEISYLNIGGATGEFVVQYKDHANYYASSNERMNFQIRLNLSDNTIKIVYGQCTLASTTTDGTTAQAGLRGSTTTYSTNVNNLMVGNVPTGTTCNWSDAVTGNANSSTMLYSFGTNPGVSIPNGMTYTWTPGTVAPVRTFSAVTNILANAATINWTAPSGATQYNIQYRIPGTCAWTSYSGNPVTGTTATLNGLTPFTTYQVSVQSSDGTNNAIWSHIPNAAGSGNGYTTTGTFTTLATCGLPTAVAVPASSINSTQATVNWTAPTIGPPTGYKWEVRTSGAAGSGPTGLVATGTSATTTATPNTLTSATTYSVYVRTLCGASDSSGWTSAVNFTTLCTTPAPGATIASISTGLCVGSTVSFSITTATPGPGVTYQWQSSLDNTTYTNISGATSATYTGAVSAKYYRCMVKCAAGPDSTASTPVPLTYNNNVVSTTNNQRCGVGTVALQASGSAGTTLNWFTDPTGGTAVGTGSSFTTPSINATTNFYVSAEANSLITSNGGRLAPAGTSNTTPSNYGLVFNATTAFTLNSVDVYNNGSAGTMVIQLQNSSGTAIQTSGTFNVPAATGTTPYTATLGWAIPVGTGYRLLVTTGSASLVRESSLGGFPYAVGSVASITNGYISGTSTTYYYLYNWSYTATVNCIGPRVPVTATVNAPPAFTITGNKTSCNNAIVPLTVTSTQSSFNTYTWSPATNLYTDANATVPYVAGASATTVYYKSNTAGAVTITANAANSTTQCAAVATTTLTVLPASATAIATPASICYSGSTTLTFTPSAGYGAATFQWQSSMNNTTFVDTNGTDVSYTTPVLTSTRYYRVVIKNSDGVACFNSVSDTALVYNPAITGTTPAVRCGPGTLVLSATATNGTASWYANATGGTPLFNGASFTTPSISSTTTYYVAGTVGSNQAITTIGAGALTSVSGNPDYTGVSPYAHHWGNYKHQMLLTVAELNSAGITAGMITSLAFDVATPGSPAVPFNNFSITLIPTNQTAMTSTFVTGGSQVYTAASVTPTAGLNTYTFSTPFPWDGISNIVVQTCFNNNNSGAVASSAEVKYDNTSFVSHTIYRVDGTQNTVCSATSGNTNNDGPTISKRPKITLGYNSACESPRQAVIATVNPLPAITVTPNGNVPICAGTTTTLTAAGGGTYQWKNAAGNINNQTNAAFTTGTAGVYKVVVTNPTTGCYDSSAAITVAVNPLPVLNLGNDTTFCSGNTLTLNAGNPGSTYLWNDNNTNATKAVTTSGSYSVKVTNSSNCSKSDTIHVTVNPTPVVNLGNDTNLCLGVNYVLNAGNPGAAYLWDNASTAQTRTISVTGTYHVKVTNAFNCAARDTIVATYLPTPVVNLGADRDVCAGTSVTLDAGNPTESFLWDNGSTGQTRTVNTSGTYHVTVSNVANCKASDTVTVTVHPLPVVNLGNDTVICHGKTLTLDALNPGASYRWNDNSTNQTLPVTATGNYSVVVTDVFSCVSTDNINVLVKDLPSGNINAVYSNNATYVFNVLNARYVSNYTWDFGDGSARVTGAVVEHQYARNGIYTVTVMLAGECDDSLGRSRTVDVFDATGGTGIPQIKDSKVLLLYPNPARDIVTLENKHNLKMKHITVYNVVGQIISDGKADTEDKHILHTQAYAPGIYTIRIETDKGLVLRKFEIMK